MKVAIGFLLGLGTAWAALAIWQRAPIRLVAAPDTDDSREEDDIDRIVRDGERPNVQMRMTYPPPPFIDPYAFVTRGPYQS